MPCSLVVFSFLTQMKERAIIQGAILIWGGRLDIFQMRLEEVEDLPMRRHFPAVLRVRRTRSTRCHSQVSRKASCLQDFVFAEERSK